MASPALTTEARKKPRSESPLTRMVGPAALTAAITSPRALRMGAATLETPASLSPRFSAHPRARTRASSALSCGCSVMVRGVSGSSGHRVNRTSCRSSGRKASSSLPVLVEWAGMRCPMRPNRRSVCGLSRRSTYATKETVQIAVLDGLLGGVAQLLQDRGRGVVQHPVHRDARAQLVDDQPEPVGAGDGVVLQD